MLNSNDEIKENYPTIEKSFEKQEIQYEETPGYTKLLLELIETEGIFDSSKIIQVLSSTLGEDSDD